MQTPWLDWHYVIFWVPLALAAILLLLSGMGSHHSGQGHHSLHFHAHPGAGGHGTHVSTAAGHGAAAHSTAMHTASHASGAHAPAIHDPGAHQPGVLGHHDGSSDSRLTVHAQSDTSGKQFHVDLSLGHHLLSIFGIGNAPLPILLGSLMMGWGLVGLISLQAMGATAQSVDREVLPALGVAAIGAYLCARIIGALAARFMPQDATSAISREDLVGLVGTVVYPVSENAGRVHVFDQYRTLHVEPARIHSGSAPAAKGQEVVVISIDPDKGHLVVDSLGLRDEQ